MNRRVSSVTEDSGQRSAIRLFRSRRRRPVDGATTVPSTDAVSKKTAVNSAPVAPFVVSGPLLLLSCISILVATLGLLYHLHIRFEGIRLGYETGRARKAQAQLMLELRELRLELASMKEPGRIENEAREKLGMEAPQFDRIIPVNNRQKVVTVSGGAL